VTPTYIGPQWTNFSPSTVVVIVPPPTPMTVIVLVDTTTGLTFTRPVGTDGPFDEPTLGVPTTPVPVPGPTGRGSLYALTFSNPRSSGTLLGNSAAECTNLFRRGNHANVTVVVGNGSIFIKASNALLVGTVSGGAFRTLSPTFNFPRTGQSFAVIASMTGTLSSSRLRGSFVEAINPPGASCTYSVRGSRVFIP
jgi:hypothetical protein